MNTDPINVQVNVVSDLEEDVRYYEAKLHEMKKRLRMESEKLRGMCVHREYRTESNNDYHRPGVYYVCNTCKLIMLRKPE